MAIKLVQGDLLSAKGIIIHGCNAQGVMGSGVALAIRQKWPIAYEKYRVAHATYGLGLGDIQLVNVSDEVVVVNAITQEYFGKSGYRYVNYDAIASCFTGLNKLLKEKKLKHNVVNFPRIGAGLGGGDWEIIEKIIDRTLDDRFEKVLWVM